LLAAQQPGFSGGRPPNRPDGRCFQVGPRGVQAHDRGPGQVGHSRASRSPTASPIRGPAISSGPRRTGQHRRQLGPARLSTLGGRGVSNGAGRAQSMLRSSSMIAPRIRIVANRAEGHASGVVEAAGRSGRGPSIAAEGEGPSRLTWAGHLGRDPLAHEVARRGAGFSVTSRSTTNRVRGVRGPIRPRPGSGHGSGSGAVARGVRQGFPPGSSGDSRMRFTAAMPTPPPHPCPSSFAA